MEKVYKEIQLIKNTMNLIIENWQIIHPPQSRDTVDYDF